LHVYYLPHTVKRLTKIMRPTIKDVAKLANVSTATVSLSINGHSRITPETKRKVENAIKELGYFPSRSARDLASRKTGNIGFILTDDHFLKTEPFYTQIYLGTEFEARKYPYYMLLATIPNNFGDDDELPRFILERSVDGILIAGKVSPLFLERIKAYKLPTVMIDFYTSENNHSAVLIDNIGGVGQAINYLILHGHKKIAFLCAEQKHPSIMERYQGYKMALENNNITFSDKLVVSLNNIISKESGYEAARELNERGGEFSAVLACNDAMAIGAMQFFKAIGKRIPGDVSIIGFDGVDVDLYQEPPLSTISVPKIEMGQEAIQLMLQILEKKINNHKKIIVPVELIIRDSVK